MSLCYKTIFFYKTDYKDSAHHRLQTYVSSEKDLLHPNSLACLSTNDGQLIRGRIGAATLSVSC